MDARARGALAVSAALLLFGATALGEQLAMRFYTTADGLARDDIHCIVQNKSGPIWFGTSEGVSRFDGTSFRTFRVSDGLPGRDVHRILLTREGGVWAATSGGLARMQPASGPKSTAFVQVPLGGTPGAGVDRLLEDSHGAIWAGSFSGLFRLEPGRAPQRIELPLESGASLFDQVFPGAPDPHQPVFALLEDRRGDIWIGTSAGLYRYRADGRITLFSKRNGLPGSLVLALLEDSDQMLWVGTTAGLTRVRVDSAGNRLEVERTFTSRDGLADNSVKALLRASDGSLWVGTRSGLARFSRENNGAPRFRTFGVSNGLVYADIEFLAEDSLGNVWVATDGGGAARIAPGGFTTFDQSDGFSPAYVGTAVLDRKGRPLILTSTDGNLVVNRFDGRRFTAVELAAPEGFHPKTWVPWHQIVLESRSGNWWSTSFGGVVRYPAPGESPPRMLRPDRIFGTADGLPDVEVGNILEDSKGNLWIATLAGGFMYPKLGGRAGVSVLPAGSRVIHRFSESDGLPPLDSVKVISMFEDRAGQIWLGMHRTGIARYRNGRFQVFTAKEGVPYGGIRQFHQDDSGHLWVASASGGLGRIDDPAAERLAIATFTSADGLSSDEIQTITSDRLGRIYAGTGLGVDRFDLPTRHVVHFTVADGLAAGEVQDSIRDLAGNLWFGTLVGISRLSPGLDPPERPVPVVISAIRIAGRSHALAGSGPQDSGPAHVSLPDLQPSQANLEIEFTGPPSASILRYQHRLDGTDRDWSPTSELRTVAYANLRDGTYHFLVRSVTTEGAAGVPATVNFTVLPQLWQRWWFLVSVALLAAAGVRVAYQTRVAHLLEIERMRTRIAYDIHDDVGSALSKIVILSEAAQYSGGSAALPALSRIAETSREVLEGVSDLVWATNPKTGCFEDLIQRMRRFGTQILEAGNVDFHFDSAAAPPKQKLSPETIRHLYLIFKECVNNAAKHSGCTQLSASLRVEHGIIILAVYDNGRGFSPVAISEGNGLLSLKSRAASLKGKIVWSFNPGTTVTLTVPLPKTLQGRPKAEPDMS